MVGITFSLVVVLVFCVGDIWRIRSGSQDLLHDRENLSVFEQLISICEVTRDSCEDIPLGP